MHRARNIQIFRVRYTGSPAFPVEVSFHDTRAPDREGTFSWKLGGGVCTASQPSEVALNVHVCNMERNE